MKEISGWPKGTEVEIVIVSDSCWPGLECLHAVRRKWKMVKRQTRRALSPVLMPPLLPETPTKGEKSLPFFNHMVIIDSDIHRKPVIFNLSIHFEWSSSHGRNQWTRLSSTWRKNPEAHFCFYIISWSCMVPKGSFSSPTQSPHNSLLRSSEHTQSPEYSPQWSTDASKVECERFEDGEYMSRRKEKVRLKTKVEIGIAILDRSAVDNQVTSCLNSQRHEINEKMMFSMCTENG